MGSFMFAEINQALALVRKNGWISTSDWPLGAEISPSEVDLTESAGRLFRASPADEMDAEKLQQLARSAGLEFDIECCSVIDSTNRLLMQRFQIEASTVRLVVCDYQSSGRGRRGRQWISPYARSLAFSYARDSKKSLHELGGLSCVVGLAVTDVLSELGITDAGLKWPNDVWLEGGKLAGILVELARRGPNTAVIIGVGINLALKPEERESVDQPVVDLRSLGVTIDRNNLLMKFLPKLVAYLDRFEKYGFEAFMQAFDAAHLMHQREVVIHAAGSQKSILTRGRAVGIGRSGQLWIETEKGLEEILGGEVSLRPANPKE